MEYLDKDLKFSKQAGLNVDKASGTDGSQAIAQKSRAGKVTSSTTTLAADTVETITITNLECKASSIVVGNVRGGGAAAGALSVCFTPSAGSLTAAVRNNTPATAADAAYIVEYLIINPVV